MLIIVLKLQCGPEQSSSAHGSDHKASDWYFMKDQAEEAEETDEDG